MEKAQWKQRKEFLIATILRKIYGKSINYFFFFFVQFLKFD